MRRIGIRTSLRNQLVNITRLVNEALREMGAGDGLCLLYVPHTTAGITINEGADPSVARDITDALGRLVPPDEAYSHAEGNADSHIKSVLVGQHVLVPVADGRLALGRWQSVFFCEFDGPRSREVWLWFLKVS